MKCTKCGAENPIPEENIVDVEWELDLGIPLDLENVLEVSSELSEQLKDEGIESPSSGAGFGFRNTQFTTEDEKLAKRAKQIAEVFMEEQVKGTKEKPYVSLTKTMRVRERVE